MIRSLLFALLLVGWFYGLRIDYSDSDTIKINVVVGPFADEASCKADLPDAVKFFTMLFGDNIQATGCKKLGEAI